MHDKLIGYLLGALQVEETVYVEQILDVDAEVRRQFEILQMGLAPLEADRKHVEAPARLAVRTCQRIREVRDLHKRQ
jgi:anti-sigma-K factor RskA